MQRGESVLELLVAGNDKQNEMSEPQARGEPIGTSLRMLRLQREGAPGKGIQDSNLGTRGNQEHDECAGSGSHFFTRCDQEE